MRCLPERGIRRRALRDSSEAGPSLPKVLLRRNSFRGRPSRPASAVISTDMLSLTAFSCRLHFATRARVTRSQENNSLWHCTAMQRFLRDTAPLRHCATAYNTVLRLAYITGYSTVQTSFSHFNFNFGWLLPADFNPHFSRGFTLHRTLWSEW